METAFFSNNVLAGIAAFFLTASVVLLIIDHYKTKRQIFEDTLTIGQSVKVINRETSKIETTWIKEIDLKKSQVETEHGTYGIKQLLS